MALSCLESVTARFNREFAAREVSLLEETTFFEGERIGRLVDDYDEANTRRIVAHLRGHGPELGIGAG